MVLALLISAAVIATCGLVYELISGTIASYLLGDSVTQFSTIIGAYLFAMGIGSYLSKFVKTKIIYRFVEVELLLGLLGGFMAVVLFAIFAWGEFFRFALYGSISLIGILVGLEIPLLLRILKSEIEFSELVAKVLSFDYLGALLASLLFPLFLLPNLGLVKTGLLFGLLNALVGVLGIIIFAKKLQHIRSLVTAATIIIVLLTSAFFYADPIQSFAEAGVYPGRVILAQSSPYQRIVLTREDSGDTKLFLNGHLQFSAKDEYRYHEALVHVAAAQIPSRRRVLILGGGDGLALREVLKYSDVESITVVDLDKVLTELFATNPILTTFNNNAYAAPSVKVVNADAFIWLRENKQLFELIIVDFPDPTNFSIGKLYTTAFYTELFRSLTDSGAAVVQSTSPYFARKSFWSVAATIKETGFNVIPYHAYLPSFGEWGFMLISKQQLSGEYSFPDRLRFITHSILPSLFNFSNDMLPQAGEDIEVNRLTNQALVHYYQEEWGSWG